MDFDVLMDDALNAGGPPGAVAVACADVRAGFVIGASARGEEEREAATNAAACAAQICALPSVLASPSSEEPRRVSLIDDGEETDASGALIVSSSWIHAYARVERRPELVVVGVARGDANVALLLAWVKSVAGGLEAAL